MRDIKTKYGLVRLNNWGKGNCYQITVDPVRRQTLWNHLTLFLSDTFLPVTSPV
jgi:hypothetical protein